MLDAGRKAALIAILSSMPAATLIAATSEQVVQDRHTGLALGGVDPVNYFTEGQPHAGLADFETSEAGAVWRFRNSGNLLMFKARPDVYGPQFGGYDPVDIARGVPCPGNPQIWLISGQRLYLFSSENHRDAFVADATRALRDAQAQWPVLRITLAE
jgi:hypothetical protein